MSDSSSFEEIEEEELFEDTESVERARKVLEMKPRHDEGNCIIPCKNDYDAELNNTKTKTMEPYISCFRRIS